MYYTIVTKIFSMLVSILIAINGLTFTVPDFAQKYFDAAVAYDFANSTAGSAAGTVTVTSANDGDYELFWGDEDLNKLTVVSGDITASYSEFATVSVCSGEGSADIQSFTAIPEGAETVLIYKNKVFSGFAEVPENKQADNGEKLYSFGALSDLHFNRYHLSLISDDAVLTFTNALNFLDAFDVSLVGMSGDLSSAGECIAFKSFNEISSKYDFPVYTTTGNHDVSTLFSADSWRQYVNAGVYGEEKAEGVLNVSDNGMDFVYSAPGSDDVFVFFCQTSWDYGKSDSRLVTDEQLDWLQRQLETYKDRTVYLFFHTFLANPDGNPGTGEGNLVNSVGGSYDLVFTQGAADEARFRSMLQEYKNVVCFNGHSHWAFDMQSFNENLNVTDYNGSYCTMVHISSVSSPRRITDLSLVRSEYDMRASEGYLVTVYDDHIVLQGCDFMRNELLAYATYSITVK